MKHNSFIFQNPVQSIFNRIRLEHIVLLDTISAWSIIK